MNTEQTSRNIFTYYHPSIISKTTTSEITISDEPYLKTPGATSEKVVSSNYSIFKWCGPLTLVPLMVKRLKNGGRGEEEGCQFDPPCRFSKNISSKERVKTCFFRTFNIIISHIFPENVIESPQIVQKIWRISLSVWPIFINFHQFFGF